LKVKSKSNCPNKIHAKIEIHHRNIEIQVETVDEIYFDIQHSFGVVRAWATTRL